MNLAQLKEYNECLYYGFHFCLILWVIMGSFYNKNSAIAYIRFITMTMGVIILTLYIGIL